MAFFVAAFALCLAAGAFVVAAGVVLYALRRLKPEILAQRAVIAQLKEDNGVLFLAVKQSRIRNDEFARLRSEQSQALQDLRAKAADVLDSGRADVAEARRLADDSRQIVPGLVDAVGGVRAELDAFRSSNASVASDLDQLKKSFAFVCRRFEATEAIAEKVLPSHNRLKERFETLSTGLDAAFDADEGFLARMSRVGRRSSGLNAALANNHDRVLGDKAVASLCESLAPALGLKVDPQSLYHLAHKICVAEDVCDGRSATSIQTMVARLMAARSLCKPDADLHILEIGTLYGVFAGCAYRFLRPFTKSLRMTLIDPLFGYYETDCGDPIALAPVARDTLDRNLRQMGVPAEAVHIIEALSGSEEALRRTEGEVFDYLLIDGDHTFDGVKADFENYRPRVRPGGLIVFDDYRVPEWPDITRYVSKDVEPRTDVERVAVGWRSAIFRTTS